VERVLEAGREVAFEAPVLLTAQPVRPASGTVVPPNGLEVLIGSAPAGTVATVVQLVNLVCSGRYAETAFPERR
jgi:hypothetical protein